MLAAAIMFVAILISSLGTHSRIAGCKTPPRRRLTIVQNFREMAATWSNRSFLFLTLAGLATAMAAGLAAAMNIYINTFFWEFTSKQFAALVLAVFVSAFIALGSAGAAGAALRQAGGGHDRHRPGGADRPWPHEPAPVRPDAAQPHASRCS